VPAARSRDRRDNAVTESGASKRGIVVGRVALPALGPAVQVFQLDAQHRRLQFVDPEIAADERMKILRLAAVHAQHPHVLGELRVIDRAQSRIAEGAEILARKEREAADVADRADAHAAVLGADRLRGIFDDFQAVCGARSPSAHPCPQTAV
jgi:hypothetical protein